MTRGFTLIEIVVVVLLCGMLVGVATPRLGRWMDRLAAEQAAAEIASFYQRARFTAVFRSTRVRLEFAEDSLRGVLEGVTDSTFLVVPGPAHRGVRLEVSRAVIRIHPNGIGWGAANTKLVLRRGAAEETLTTSRLGRLKWWR